MAQELAIPLASFQAIEDQEKVSAESRGEFFRPNFWVNFAWDFWVAFFVSFSLEKQEELRGQNPHSKVLALTSSSLTKRH